MFRTAAFAAVLNSTIAEPVGDKKRKQETMSSSYSFAPRTMPAPAAAHYLGISQSKLLTRGIPRKIDGGNRLYDIRDLDSWVDSLQTEGECVRSDATAADDAFGI